MATVEGGQFEPRSRHALGKLRSSRVGIGCVGNRAFDQSDAFQETPVLMEQLVQEPCLQRHQDHYQHCSSDGQCLYRGQAPNAAARPGDNDEQRSGA